MYPDTKTIILLAGKDKILRDSIKLYLDSKGFEVLATASFNEALNHLRRQTSDLIISEHVRPSTDELDFFKDLKRLRLAPQAYKIIVCDSCSPENGCDGLEQHADLCISKPLTKESVSRMLLHINAHYGRENQR